MVTSNTARPATKPAMSVHTRAALLMLGSTGFFAVMVITIRLASESLHTFEVAFFRSFFGMLAALPLLYKHGPGLLRTRQLPRYFVRCVLGTLSMFCGFWAIGNLPLAQAVSLSYSTPLFVTIAAVLWLGEQVRVRRWSAVVLGFIGVLIIVRPGTAEFSAGTLIAISAAIISGIVAIQIKQLSYSEPADRIVILTTILWVPMSLVPALFVWEWPHGIVWLWVVCAGVLGTAGHMLWTRALKLGDVSALTPISFMQLPIVAVFGFFLFGEDLDRWTVLGAAIIFIANGYIAHREARLARLAATTAPTTAVKPGQ